MATGSTNKIVRAWRPSLFGSHRAGLGEERERDKKGNIAMYIQKYEKGLPLFDDRQLKRRQ